MLPVASMPVNREPPSSNARTRDSVTGAHRRPRAPLGAPPALAASLRLPLPAAPFNGADAYTVSGSSGSRPVLSPSVSGSTTPALSSIASSRLVIGVSLG